RGFEISEASKTADAGLELYNFWDVVEKEDFVPHHPGFLEYLGGQFHEFLGQAGGVVILIYDAAYWTFVAPFKGKGFRAGAVLREIARNGFAAVPVVSLVSLLFGLVLAINGAYLLGKYGQNRLIADMVGMALAREIGPVLAGIMLAARSGAGITAEIGTMEVREEIDAMWAMGMNPGKFLIVPKVLAVAISVPILTLVCNVVGNFGSFLASSMVFGVPGRNYLMRLASAVLLKDFLTGVGKAFFFGLIVGFVGCWFGFSVERSAEEVGNNTTKAVVWSIILIIMADGVFSALFYVLS
ncbi:MAG: ABC transporter permease, partial [Planctomycetes bacterium]|nr:ABC transporter permease [Planctomycetota bacterium]